MMIYIKNLCKIHVKVHVVIDLFIVSESCGIYGFQAKSIQVETCGLFEDSLMPFNHESTQMFLPLYDIW